MDPGRTVGQQRQALLGPVGDAELVLGALVDAEGGERGGQMADDPVEVRVVNV